MYLLTEPKTQPLRIYSDGAGTQSVAVMILQAQGKLLKPYDYFVFANVGDDSEKAEVLEYRRKYIIPFCEARGIKTIERQRLYKGKSQTLLQSITNPDNGTIAAPVHFGSGGKGNRKCTQDWKVAVVERYLKTEMKATRVEMGLGFSLEEGGRIYQKYQGWHDVNWKRNTKTRQWDKGARLGFWRKFEYPLVDAGMTKQDCIDLAVSVFGEAPPSSLCWFCPFTRIEEWRRRKRADHPYYTQAVELEQRMNEKYAALNRTTVNPSSAIFLNPLRIALKDIPDQPDMFEQFFETDGQCESLTCGL